MQTIDLPSAAIHLDLHSVSMPTSELNLHTLDLSSVSVHSVHTPTSQNLHTRSVTPIYFEIEGELAEKKLRVISKYSNIISRSCDHNGGIITSEDADLKLTIPKDAIEKGVSVRIFIATSLFDPFMPHRNSLANPYYYIVVSKSYRFYKPEFQHFAVVTACDPSHFQLLSCEDDDESFTMKPVDYALTFSLQDGISWCTFQTDRFCSYCLSHNCSDPMITKIGAFFLKPENFQSLNKFTVQLWFSFPISSCLKRKAELYTCKGMILDTDCSCIFDAASDKSSTSYFALNYDQCNDGWNVNHFRFDKIQLKP